MPTAGWTRVRGLLDRISSVTGLWFGRRRSLTRRPRPAARRWREVVRGRLVVGGVVVVIWALGIEARLFYLQVLNHDELTARAEGQQSRSIDAHPKRGEILDRNGRMLAYSVDGDAIYAVPSEIEDAVGTATRLCEALDCSDATRQALEGRLKKTSRAFEWVQRQVAPDAAQRVADLDLLGVGFVPENRRYYPNGELAAHVLGYVGIDNQGLSGIESTYDSEISGRPGRLLVQTDARRRAFSRLERPPTAGATLELTIDTYLQHIAERELEAGVRQHDADAGTIVVLDPYNGDILAMANWPTFNPNAFAHFSEGARRNRAIQDIYEPGSTFKLVTASAALEEGVVTRDEKFDISAGFIRVGRTRVHDMYVYPDPMSFDDLIVKSSNVGAIMVGLRLGAERLSRYVRRFGFGQALALDLPGQQRGLVHAPVDLESQREIASVSIGYAVSVTPLQMAMAVSAVANGGLLVQPRLVRATIRQGIRTEKPARTIRRAISSETAAELTEIMEAVAERGTARRAQAPGYRVAGKTGTTEKVIDGRYSNTDHNVSFIGFVPARRPEFVVLVMIDTPRQGLYTGGVVAAPIFRRFAEAALRYLAVPRTVNPTPPILAQRPTRSLRVQPASARQSAPAVSLEPEDVDVQAGVMPDFRGLSAREALRTIGSLKMIVRLHGDGFVTEQDPAPDTPVAPGAVATLSLERRQGVRAEGHE